MAQYPLPEQLTITLTKSPNELSVWERLLLADLLEAIKRVKRSVHDRKATS